MIDKTIMRIKRFFYVRAMMNSIEIARYTSPLFDKRKTSKTDCLSVIKEFERQNNIEFNPFNKSHNDKIFSMAHHTGFFRRMKLIFKQILDDKK